MSKPHRISAIGNVELSSQLGTVNHASKATFAHDDNKHLADLTNLRGALNAGDLLFFDSANDAIAGIAKADFALAADLDDYETVANVSTLAGRVTTIEEAGYQTASDVSSAISAIDYSAYETTSNATSTYETIANVDTLAGRVSTLEGAGYQDSSDVSGAISSAISAIDYSSTDLSVGKISFGEHELEVVDGYLKYDSAILQTQNSAMSLGANGLTDVGVISFSGGADLDIVDGHLNYNGNDLVDSDNIASYGYLVSSDLSSYATLEGAEELTNKTIVAPIVSNVKHASDDADVYEKHNVYRTTLTAENNNVALETIAMPVNNECAVVCVKFSASGLGFCELKSMFISDGTDVTLVADSDSLELFGSSSMNGAVVLDISGSNVIVKGVKPSYASSVKIAVSCSVMRYKAL